MADEVPADDVVGAVPTTIVVTQREVFSTTARSLEHLLANSPPRPLVYVDGGSPPKIRRWLEAAAHEHDFTLLRTEHHLTPNEARNLALPFVETEFVAFADNDLIVDPGWLEALESCAADTGAWMVAPLIGIGDPARPMVHQGGAEECHLEDRDGRTNLRVRRPLTKQTVAEARPTLERIETEVIEFHAVLVRRDVFDRFGPLDEELRTTREHLDLSLAVRGAGGTIWSEPASYVTYVRPDPVPNRDLGFYTWRWNDASSASTLAHFYEKWGMSDADEAIERQRGVIRRRRRIGYRPYRSTWAKRVRYLDKLPIAAADRLYQPAVTKRNDRKRSNDATARVIHRPTT